MKDASTLIKIRFVQETRVKNKFPTCRATRLTQSSSLLLADQQFHLKASNNFHSSLICFQFPQLKIGKIMLGVFFSFPSQEKMMPLTTLPPSTKTQNLPPHILFCSLFPNFKTIVTVKILMVITHSDQVSKGVLPETGDFVIHFYSLTTKNQY